MGNIIILLLFFINMRVIKFMVFQGGGGSCTQNCKLKNFNETIQPILSSNFKINPSCRCGVYMWAWLPPSLLGGECNGRVVSERESPKTYMSEARRVARV